MARYGPIGNLIMSTSFFIFHFLNECRGNAWPHVTSDGTAFINVTGATITLEFDVRVNSKGTFEFFLLHNQVLHLILYFASFCDTKLKPSVY
jgi:hypothetical protein